MISRGLTFTRVWVCVGCTQLISFTCVSHIGLVRSITREGQMGMTFTKLTFLASSWNSETRYGINTLLHFYVYIVLCFEQIPSTIILTGFFFMFS